MLNFAINAPSCYDNGDEAPYDHQNDGTNQCSNNGDTCDQDVTDTPNDDDLSHQPDPNERSNNAPDNPNRASILRDKPGN